MEITERVDDCRFVESVRLTDPERLKTLRSRLVSRMTFWLGSRADAEDAAQEAMLAAWVRREDFGRAASPDAWLLQCARHSAIDAWRKDSRRRGREFAWAQCHDQAVEDRNPLLGPEALRHAMSRLPAEASELLFRVHLGGESVAEIAQDEGRSSNSVHVRLHRARRALSRVVREEGPLQRVPRTRSLDTPDAEIVPIQCKEYRSAAS